MTPEQMYKERGDCSTDLQWSVCSADNKETENVILINRQRQVSFTLLRVDYGSISDVWKNQTRAGETNLNQMSTSEQWNKVFFISEQIMGGYNKLDN